MHDLAFIAATEWAKAQAFNRHDPREFGRCVAQVAFFCLQELATLAKLSTGDAPVDAADEILRAAGFSRKEQPTPTPEQRANALELSAILSRYVSCGSVIDGANLLADKFASSKGYERAAELILRASPTPLDQPPFASWGDLIAVADAVEAWLRTGEQPTDLSTLLRAFPSVSAYR